MVGIVRPIRVLALLLAAIVALAGCAFLSSSVFPEELRLYEAGVDLSASIPNDRGWGFTFRLISNSTTGAEYLVLVSDDRSFVGTHLVVFDASLRVLASYTISELDAMDTTTFTTFAGRGAMVDAAGMIVVGNRRFALLSGGLSYLSAVDALGAHGFAFLEAESTEPNIANLRADGPQLLYRRYRSDWSAFMEPGWTIDSSLSSYKLLGAWLTDTEVVLLLRGDSTSTKVLGVPRSAFAAASLYTPLADYYLKAQLYDTASLNWDTLGFTDEGFATFRYWDEGQYVRFGLDGSPIGDPWVAREHPADEVHVYGRTSGWFVFDCAERTVSRSAWWWR